MTAAGDVDLVKSDGKPTSVLAVLNEMKTRWAQVEDVRARAKALERHVYGRYTARYPSEAAVQRPLVAPWLTKNKLKNLALVASARLSKDRTTSMVYPEGNELPDLAAADVANAIIKYQRQIQDRDALMARWALMTCIHGTCAQYITQDYDAGPFKERVPVPGPDGVSQMIDPITSEPVYRYQQGKGAACVELLTIFDFVTDGARDVHKDGKWLLVKRLLDEDSARAALRGAIEAGKTAVQAGQPPPGPIPPDDNVSVQSVQSRHQTGPTRQLVEAWEMWWRPGKSSRFKDGLFAVVVSDKVIRSTTFPFQHGKLPISVWRYMDVEDDFYGATWVEDAVPSQLALNHVLQGLQARAEISGQVRGFARAGVMTRWGASSDGFIEKEPEEADLQAAQLMDFAETPDIPQDMYQLKQMYENDIGDVAGVSDIAASGDVAAETKNARLVAYATQVDEQKSEHTARNRDEAEVEVDLQTLELWQQFTENERLVRVVGADNAVEAAYFKGADLPAQIRLEAAPGDSQMASAAAKDADDQVMQGRMPAAVGNELGKTGLTSTMDEGSQRIRLQALVSMALAGQPVQADLTIDAGVAIPMLKMILVQVAAQGPAKTQPIRALIQEYQEQQGGQGNTQGPPGAQPPQGGQGGQPAPSPKGKPSAPPGGANVLPQGQGMRSGPPAQ